MTDCLIVGHGIAGAMIAFQLRTAGWSVEVYNGTAQPSCSSIAAGVINPVTGRRFVKSWMIDQLLETALEQYRAMEADFHTTLVAPRRIWQTLNNNAEEQQWLIRTGDPAYAKYMADDVNDYFGETFDMQRYGTINHAVQIDLPALVNASYAHLRSDGAIVDSEFDTSELELLENGIQYRGATYRHVVFCEGVGAVDNPFFSWLPFVPAKGELLLCEIPDLQVDGDVIVKGSVSIVPTTAPGIYWIGSTYNWEFENAEPTIEGKLELRSKLEHLLSVPYAIVDHQAAIRPTTRDRRPFVGQHPEHPNVWMLNGFGTKGASLAPYCAKILSKAMTDEQPIPREVNILRHWPR